jgi:hypothetical protein
MSVLNDSGHCIVATDFSVHEAVEISAPLDPGGHEGVGHCVEIDIRPVAFDFEAVDEEA